MRIAIITREDEPLSLASYRDHIAANLADAGVTLLPVLLGSRAPDIPSCDLVWEPGIAGNRPPPGVFRHCHAPIVATVHGAAPFSVRWPEYTQDPMAAAYIRRQNRVTLAEWSWFREKIVAAIAVSRYGAMEVATTYGMSLEMVKVIYHGVDESVFHPPHAPRIGPKPYFLHVSAFQPKKNVERLFAAYQRLPSDTRPDLIAVVPGMPRRPDIPGLSIIDRPLPAIDLAPLYGNALGFVFPSLHETFGLPIIEAMACGCPVITSFDTACAEVAGEAALLVDPRSTAKIAAAMDRLCKDAVLRERLRDKGIVRAGLFSWTQSASRHHEVFSEIAGRNR